MATAPFWVEGRELTFGTRVKLIDDCPAIPVSGSEVGDQEWIRSGEVGTVACMSYTAGYKDADGLLIADLIHLNIERNGNIHRFKIDADNCRQHMRHSSDPVDPRVRRFHRRARGQRSRSPPA